ncbi:hypothetical protein L1987_61674 [Smallanthus sonchifolius]|uniref:Uncharacterized protein n=1 Tax=Smallanthus sonchifolius TaxID=185202 RepID=A0ACB9C896_9ASTR|nr:hypothetical protein L1987_61674 [Smallanthus sonchifolius]
MGVFVIVIKIAWSDIDIPSVKSVNFTSLNSLDLSLNDINSTIPVWLSNLTSLMHLNLNDNLFHGKIPDFIGMFSDIASLHLSSNSFDTSIPDLLCNLSSLVHQGLVGNMFSGPIPTSIGLLLRLEELYLGDNQLSGNIPMSLWLLSKLKNLDLSGNLLMGVLSETHFTNLKNLNHLVLSVNSLTLNFSFGWIPPFQLDRFSASSTNIGPHFPTWLQTQTNLTRLDLSNSGISDTIPEWFENSLSRILHLDLSHNQIGGKLPRFHFIGANETGDRFLKMRSNKFEGSLATFPSNMWYLDLSDNLLSGHIPETDETLNPNLYAVNLSKNRFNGSIPVHLCKVPSIGVLDLSQNKFSGRLPGCLGNLINFYAMDLSYNNITGVIPNSLGSLKDLSSLHLQNNRFEGNIPVSLQNLTNLVTMDLANNMFVSTIPFWIGEKLYNLRFFNLQSNKFIGKIPLQLCQLNALQSLNLAHNNITGTIPRCFSNLSGMITDEVNFISGQFYYEANILVSMKGNQLVYTKTIEFLTTLDLSSNNIIGEIPDVLMNLVGLKNLNLSRNQLKGQLLELVVRNQLQTLVDPSVYEGNDGLCGPLVSRICKGNNSSYNYVGEDEVQEDDEDLWFYIGMGSGFVVGFMGLLGSLMYMRIAHFEMLENAYRWLTVSILLNLAHLQRKFL